MLQRDARMVNAWRGVPAAGTKGLEQTPVRWNHLIG